MNLDYGALSIIITITCTAFASGKWIGGRFNKIENAFRDKMDEVKTSFRDLMDEHEKADAARFESMGLRLLKVELELDKEGRHVAAVPRLANEI